MINRTVLLVASKDCDNDKEIVASNFSLFSMDEDRTSIEPVTTNPNKRIEIQNTPRIRSSDRDKKHRGSKTLLLVGAVIT